MCAGQAVVSTDDDKSCIQTPCLHTETLRHWCEGGRALAEKSCGCVYACTLVQAKQRSSSAGTLSNAVQLSVTKCIGKTLLLGSVIAHSGRKLHMCALS